MRDETVEVLRTARRIAIVGASPHAWRASHSVMEYLLEQGYDCVPVNARWPARCSAGPASRRWRRRCADGGGAFDIVDVFRRPEHAPDIARSAVALGCGTLWLQQGIVSWEAARIAHEGGLTVVMDRCTAVDHRGLR